MGVKINEYPLLEVTVDDIVLHIPLETVILFPKFSGCLWTVMFIFSKE